MKIVVHGVSLSSIFAILSSIASIDGITGLKFVSNNVFYPVDIFCQSNHRVISWESHFNEAEGAQIVCQSHSNESSCS